MLCVVLLGLPMGGCVLRLGFGNVICLWEWEAWGVFSVVVPCALLFLVCVVCESVCLLGAVALVVWMCCFSVIHVSG